MPELEAGLRAMESLRMEELEQKVERLKRENEELTELVNQYATDELRRRSHDFE